MIHFVYKGIDIVFSDGAEKIAPSKKDRDVVLKSFFEDNPLNAIHWVSEEESKSNNNGEGYEMFHMSNDYGETLIFWPLLDKENSNLILHIENLEERPDVKEEIKDELSCGET